ncbi:hypothetical protein GQ42DRAFT_156059 [Ramicandelaber brevisporus]|nr:hypothetical protein GQ42DRAFT_156059 [Ramicandelaber brevisporus]
MTASSAETSGSSSGSSGGGGSTLSRRLLILSLVAGMLATGTILTLLQKVQDMQCVSGCEPPPLVRGSAVAKSPTASDRSSATAADAATAAAVKRKDFEQPIYQSLSMCLGEMLCLVVYFAIEYRRKRKLRSSGYQTLSSSPSTADLTTVSAVSQSSGSASGDSAIASVEASSEQLNDEYDLSAAHGSDARISFHNTRAASEDSDEYDGEHSAVEVSGALSPVMGRGSQTRKRLLSTSSVSQPTTPTTPTTYSNSISPSSVSTEPVKSLPELQGWRLLLVWIPALCDILATTLMNIGLLYTAASVYSMLRGSLVLFVGGFSILFARRVLRNDQWVALSLIFFGVGIVGVSSIIGNHSKQKVMVEAVDPGRAALGVFLIIIAQLFSASQFVVEERILADWTIAPAKVVGLEGTFGAITILSIMTAILVSSPSSNGGMLDVRAGWHQIISNPTLIWTFLVYMPVIAAFNFFGLMVTQNVSATSRSTIDACRTLTIWAISLGLGWEHFSWLQVVGFTLLVYGTFWYNGVEGMCSDQIRVVCTTSRSHMVTVPLVTLSNGAKMPAIGFGVMYATLDAAKAALDAGYRHFDCAAFYKNEHVFGQALKSSDIPRSSLWITGKIWGNHHDDPEVSLDKTLADLGTDYLDLLLLHYPLRFDDDTLQFVNPRKTDIPAVWKKLEALVDSGKVKAIGVSNFTAKLLDEELLPIARIKPVLNQVEMHPYLQQKKLVEYGKQHGVHITAYCPLGGGFQDPIVMNDETIAEIAKKHNVAASTILLSWGVQRGTSLIPRSTSPERMKQNLKTIQLDDEDMDAIANIKTVKRYVDLSAVWGPHTKFVFED